MEGWRLIQSIRLENILSFGPDMTELPLEPLNVLVGPNGAGKSNFIEALSLLAAAPKDLQEPIRRGGGVREWLWKGVSGTPTATLEVTSSKVGLSNVLMPALRYRLSFTCTSGQFSMVDEVIEDDEPGPVGEAPEFYYRYQQGNPAIKVVTSAEVNQPQIAPPPPVSDRLEQFLPLEEVNRDQSILLKRRDSKAYPELWWVHDLFAATSFYRELDLSRGAPIRLPQKLNLPQGRLMEDASNLSVVLSDLLNQPDLKERILERMRDFYPSFRDVTATVSGGKGQIFFHEKGLHHPVPATRLSGASLRYLCLLTILCYPYPHFVICIEKPELGLHPDIIPEVAKLLVEASSVRQIFVTTHSDILVDALTETPEAIIVCEKEEGATRMRRLDTEELKLWLEVYRSLGEDVGLGQMWMRGEIGGTRW